MNYINEEPKKEVSESGFFGKCWAEVGRDELHKCKKCLHRDCPYHARRYYTRKMPVVQLICAILTGIYAIVFVFIFLNTFDKFAHGKTGWGDVLGELVMPLILISIVILLISDIRRIIDKKVDRDFELKEDAKNMM